LSSRFWLAMEEWHSEWKGEPPSYIARAISGLIHRVDDSCTRDRRHATAGEVRVMKYPSTLTTRVALEGVENVLFATDLPQNALGYLRPLLVGGWPAALPGAHPPPRCPKYVYIELQNGFFRWWRQESEARYGGTEPRGYVNMSLAEVTMSESKFTIGMIDGQCISFFDRVYPELVFKIHKKEDSEKLWWKHALKNQVKSYEEDEDISWDLPMD